VDSYKRSFNECHYLRIRADCGVACVLPGIELRPVTLSKHCEDSGEVLVESNLLRSIVKMSEAKKRVNQTAMVGRMTFFVGAGRVH
jgi:hypothetical protein